MECACVTMIRGRHKTTGCSLNTLLISQPGKSKLKSLTLSQSVTVSPTVVMSTLSHSTTMTETSQIVMLKLTQIITMNCKDLNIRDPGMLLLLLHLFLKEPAKGFYLGIKDTGTCGSIKRLQFYYLVCPSAAVHLVRYPEVALPPDGVTSPTVAQATCVANAELDSGESADIRAFHDGRCEFDVSCHCLEGYEENPAPAQNGGTDPAVF